MTSSLSFHYIFNVYKNYKMQIIQYKGFANIHETQNVQCKIYVKCKIHEAQNVNLQNMCKT